MGRIPQGFLPPKEYLPNKIYDLPELVYPDKLNLIRSFYDIVKDEKKVILYYGDKKITMAEARRNINKIANGLRSLGVGKYDRVMIRGPNCPEYIYNLYACYTIGAIPVLVPVLLRTAEIVQRANDSKAKVVIISSNTWMGMDEAIPQFKTTEKLIIFGERKARHLFYDDIVRDQSVECEIEDTSRYDITRLIYSSGTTGVPKGVISHIDDLFGITNAHKHVLSLTEKDVVGGWAEFAYALGAAGTIFPTCCGCALSLVDRPTPEEMFETIQKHKITVLRSTPTFYEMMLGVDNAENRYDLSSLRLCASAGEPLSRSACLEWRERFGVELIDYLGSGELGIVIARPERCPEDKLGATGKLVPGMKAKIVGENFNEVPLGVWGELLVQGPMGQEYWRRPGKQKEAVHNGWNRTGLIYRKDEDGYFWYKGRVDDMIVTSGYKIPAGEVENTLLCHESVLETAVVASPDLVRGNVVKAFIVLNEGYEPSDELRKELQDYVKANLEPYKYPRKIEFIDSRQLPRTSTGKIKRNSLRQTEFTISPNKK